MPITHCSFSVRTRFSVSAGQVLYPKATAKPGVWQMTISHVDHEPSYSSYPVLCGIFHYFKTISYTQARPLSQVKLFHNIADNYATFTGKLRWRKIFKAQDNKERYTLHGMVGREIVQVETGMSDWYPLSTGTIALSKPALKEWYLSESDDLPGARRKGSIIVNNFC